MPAKLNREHNFHSIETIPTAQEANESTVKQAFWDEIAQQPFQILAKDILLCRELGVPLPYSSHVRRIRENFAWMPYNGTLRMIQCAKTGSTIQTAWPEKYNGRVVSEEAYISLL